MKTHQEVLPRIYFDPNEGPDNIRYALWLPQSLIDLDCIGMEPHDGMHVVIYASDCLEIEATLEFDRDCDGWTARPLKTIGPDAPRLAIDTENYESLDRPRESG